MTAPAVAALVLAAGRSSRMGSNKLTLMLDGKPLVAHVCDAALAAGLTPVVVVTGHQAETVRRLLAGRNVSWTHNADFASGMATSLTAGIAALPPETDAVLVCLGDMPRVSARHMTEIAEAFDPESGYTACVPIHNGQRGNPVLLGKQHFAEILALDGDRGARSVLAAHDAAVRRVVIDDDAILTDVDTPEAYASLGGRQP
ncbi:nucleotidyltransferase family protein [Telmatospirillum sp.]|uniref:nucleotidyltransferase family protein n=1 Tax=Telmatospirillum sp. TaxID=2079197 RepID=UPI00283ED4F5|nr:nucleotidyltransferase family protein [Telmatospirillum sp.]MDR3437776.1 nucleotidyltransferase family protein [Telmatospirillum sp.]